MPNQLRDIPNPSDLLSVSQGQLKENVDYFQGALGKDHQIVFGDTDTGTPFEGRHNQVSLKNLNGALPSAVDGSNGVVYSDTGNLYYVNTTPTTYQITPSLPVRAAITFTSVGSIGTPFNATVTRISTGIYTVTFTSTLPSVNFQYALSTNSNSADVWVVCVTSYSTGSMGIRIINTANNNNLVDPVSPASVSLMVWGG